MEKLLMLDSHTYRANEAIAKSLVPSWRISQIHNLDHFERAGFPVRLTSMQQLGQIVDTMQENRFQSYMNELGGLTKSEYDLLLEVCKDVVRFQLMYLPHRPPVLPLSTLISVFAIYKKMCGFNPEFRSVLEIGPGCGYISLFLRRHASLTNYSQIEACESFYILQNLVNLHCFGTRFQERAVTCDGAGALDLFINQRADYELSPLLRISAPKPLCVHYPWWRIGEIVSQDRKFEIVTSNANLLEFSAPALDDYLTLLHRVLEPEGIFLVQCTGFTASGTVDGLLMKLQEKGFAPLMFVLEKVAAHFPGDTSKRGILDVLKDGTQGSALFTTNNAVFVRSGHPLFEKYYDRKNYRKHFIADEPVVNAMFFARPPERRMYSMQDFVEDSERALSNGAHDGF